MARCFINFLFYTILLSNLQCTGQEIIKDGHPNIKSEYHYLALGDSYTIGHGEMKEQTFPYLLQSALSAQDFIFRSDPYVIAKTGWTCDDLSSAIRKDSFLRKEYDLVSLLIGVNDQYRGYDIRLYPQKFEILLKTAIEKAGDNPEKVIVISIPDYGFTPFGQSKNPNKISLEIDQYNAINKSVAAQFNVAYVDITDISRLALDDSSLLVSDKLHPSGKMYSMWVNKILDHAVKSLKK